jgi:YHS domain-containing protein
MKQVILFIGGVIATAGSLFAQQSAIFTTSGVAIKGYDAVAYFTESKPVKGDSSFVYHWKDADWNFANKKNQELFKANPEKYAPQYGGYCAYGTANNHKAPTDPMAWTIVDGKLYLNYNNDVKGMWSKDIPGNIKKADKIWPLIENKE